MKHTKKLALLSLGIISVFVLAGCGPQKPTDTTGSQTEEKKTVFDSIKDAMTKSLSLRCDYEANNVKSVVFIKGKNIRSETENKTGKAYAIVKDQKLWAWGDQSKQGVLMDLTKQNTQGQSANGQKSQEDIIKEVEQYKQNCQQVVVPDSQFNPPADIKFIDLSQMLNNLGGSVKP